MSSCESLDLHTLSDVVLLLLYLLKGSKHFIEVNESAPRSQLQWQKRFLKID